MNFAASLSRVKKFARRKTMNNSTLNKTTGSLCPNLPIQVTSVPYTPNATAQTITLITCIVNGISCPVATVENLLVFMVVLRRRSLRTTYNTSVLCLAFADLLIAMFIQPAFIAYQSGKYRSSTYECIPYFIKTVFEFWCVGLTFVTLALITLIRYFAVFRPFQYRILATPLRATFVIFFIWYELESLFNLVFNLNNSYSDGNDHRVRKIALGNQTACCSTHLRAGSQQGYQGDQNYFNNHWSVFYLLLSNIMRIYSASDRPGRS